MGAVLNFPAGLTGTTLIRATYDRLRGDLLSGRWEPGRKLLMHELRGRYQVGASPLREALNRLASEEWVVHNEQRGFSVAEASVERLQDLVATRIAVESLALQRAFARRNADWEESLVLAFHRLSRAPRCLALGDAAGADAGDSASTGAAGAENPAWERLHRAFHQALLQGCGSPLLLGFCEQMYDQAYRYRQLARKVGTRRDELDEHRAVFEAVIGARLADAQALIADHYQRTADIFAGQSGDGSPAV